MTRLGDGGYLADPGLATALFCAVRLPQALLLEGEPGVGKTEAAKALAEALDTWFILHAARPPIVILTSNRTRDLHDALKRRCLYHWIDYPSLERATAIVRRRVPEASVSLAEQVTAAVSRLRSLDLQKPPGVAEAINWVAAARLLGLSTLDEVAVDQTLGSVLKYREDLDLARERNLRWVAGLT